MGKLLVIDDDPMIGRLIQLMADKVGCQCQAVRTIADGIEYLRSNSVDIIFLDLLFPEGNSIGAIPQIMDVSTDSNIVMLTGEHGYKFIEDSFSAGAIDYILKPINLPRFRKIVDSLGQMKKSAAAKFTIDRSDIIGDSPKVQQCIERLAKAGASNANVLIEGETGTGKELFAKAIHKNSSRKDSPYIVVDCTNLPVNLAGSLLFGHERGSFTGADRSKKGLFELAHNGTIFLDEIGDLDLSIQKSLLRVLQEKRFRPLSSGAEVASDFRLIAATNRNLKAMVELGTFRKDLYFRLQAFAIQLPPLRERNGDIELLAHHYINMLCEESSIPPLSMDEECLSALKAYDWPGNVRELVNVLQLAIHKAMFEERLTFYHLPQQLRMSKIVRDAEGLEDDGKERAWAGSGCNFTPSGNIEEFPELKEVRRQTIRNMEQNYMRQLVLLSEKSAKLACKMSGLSRARLYELLNKYNISLRDS